VSTCGFCSREGNEPYAAFEPVARDSQPTFGLALEYSATFCTCHLCPQAFPDRSFDFVIGGCRSPEVEESAATFQPAGRIVRPTFGQALCDRATLCPFFSYTLWLCSPDSVIDKLESLEVEGAAAAFRPVGRIVRPTFG